MKNVPIHIGIQHGTIFGTQPYGLPLSETTTPQYLKSLGYATHGVGKVKKRLLPHCNTPSYSVTLHTGWEMYRNVY